MKMQTYYNALTISVLEMEEESSQTEERESESKTSWEIGF